MPPKKSPTVRSQSSFNPKTMSMMSPSRRLSKKSGSRPAPRPQPPPPPPPPPAASKRGRDPNYQCRVDIYDELRKKCAQNTANCKAIAADGISPLSYSDCERLGATAADLLGNFPTDKEANKRLQLLLRKGRDSGEPDKKDWDLGSAKKCLTQMWYGTEGARARLDACPPPIRSIRAGRKQKGKKRPAAAAAAANAGPVHRKSQSKRTKTNTKSLLGFL